MYFVYNLFFFFSLQTEDENVEHHPNQRQYNPFANAGLVYP